MKRFFLPFFFCCLLAMTLACRFLNQGATPAGTTPTPFSPPNPATPTEPPIANVTAGPTELRPSTTPLPLATKTPPPARTPDPWPSPLPPLKPFDPWQADANVQQAVEQLTNLALPERDDVALAIAFNGYVGPEPTRPAVTQPLEVGEQAIFNILNSDTNEIETMQAQLWAVSDHAYFWFDNDLAQPRQNDLAEATAGFDQIYEQDRAAFGPESSPGIDGDSRIHIVNAAPSVLCADAFFCGLAGYFSSSDTLPAGVYAASNEREMFVMNGDLFGTFEYLDVLAHEFRHAIEHNYDQNDQDWEVEGSAMLAEDLAGFPNDPVERANDFLTHTDQPLTTWTEGDSYPYYGAGYILNRYIYDRLGPADYLRFATHPANGLAAIDALDLGFSGQQVWLDWLVALAIHDRPNAPANYQFGVDGLNRATMNQVSQYPANFNVTVNQYAADYIRLTGNQEVTLSFTGNAFVPALDSLPASGQGMWLSGRSNQSDVRLTHAFDLGEVSQATLHYAVYHDIEYSYDFGYVAISLDGGQSWQGLEAANMQDRNDDPSDSAFTDHFYTGRSEQWRNEQIDLSPYTGREVLIRFEYITDPILTFGGLAIDNIAIPEIGFYDDAESPTAGWQAEGFVWTTAYIPQQWHLQLVTFPAGTPTLTPLILTPNQTLTLPLSLSDEAILIVAATAPNTLELGHYRLEIR